MHSMMYPHVSVQVNIDVSRCIYITSMYADVSNDVYSRCILMYLYSTMYPVMIADVLCQCIPMYTDVYRCIQHHQHDKLQLWLLTLKPMHLYESQWFCAVIATHHLVLNIQHVHNAPKMNCSIVCFLSPYVAGNTTTRVTVLCPEVRSWRTTQSSSSQGGGVCQSRMPY
jgi:hypothetical protein